MAATQVAQAMEMNETWPDICDVIHPQNSEPAVEASRLTTSSHRTSSKWSDKIHHNQYKNYQKLCNENERSPLNLKDSHWKPREQDQNILVERGRPPQNKQ